MTQLPWCPPLPDLGGLAGRPELPPDVSSIEGSARPGAEDEVVIVPSRACGEPFLALPFLMGPQRVHGHLGKGQRPA